MAEIQISKQNNLTAALEALLFSYGEPMEISKLVDLLNSELEIVNQAIEELRKNLESENRGLKLIFQNNKVQLATKPEFSGFLEEFIKEEFKENLTPAALETLALIAYFGPVTRARIDYFRGVNSSFTIRNLMMRGLIERVDSSYQYQVSFDLLKYLGLSKIEELPEYEKYHNANISDTQNSSEQLREA